MAIEVVEQRKTPSHRLLQNVLLKSCKDPHRTPSQNYDALIKYMRKTLKRLNWMLFTHEKIWKGAARCFCSSLVEHDVLHLCPPTIHSVLLWRRDLWIAKETTQTNSRSCHDGTTAARAKCRICNAIRAHTHTHWWSHTSNDTAQWPPVSCEHPDPIADLWSSLEHSWSFVLASSTDAVQGRNGKHISLSLQFRMFCRV